MAWSSPIGISYYLKALMGDLKIASNTTFLNGTAGCPLVLAGFSGGSINQPYLIP